MLISESKTLQKAHLKQNENKTATLRVLDLA